MNGDVDDLLARARAVHAGSEHVLAKAVLVYAEDQELTNLKAGKRHRRHRARGFW